jgi:uncharacterized flavoprotein (TIGR03862 family)
MVADVLSADGFAVHLFEKKPAPGKKLLIAGATGLNVTNAHPEASFTDNYSGPRERFERLFREFSPADWLKWIDGIGVRTFLGTSGRLFVEGLKAAPLLKSWIKRLKARGVAFRYGHEIKNFHATEEGLWRLEFANEVACDVAAACFCLGGASYEPDEKPLRWPRLFEAKDVTLTPFSPSNAGFEVDWPERFLAEAEGKPLKNVILTSSKGAKRGELVITRYGLEGTPVYHVGQIGPITIDLKPDLTTEAILNKFAAIKENLAPLRRAKKALHLSDAALALLFHLSAKETISDASLLTRQIKSFPLVLKAQRPLDEAISSSGGISWEEIGLDYSLKKFPGLFVAGEMIDWDAPTGGFLIQACVSQGHAAAKGIIQRFAP